MAKELVLWSPSNGDTVITPALLAPIISSNQPNTVSATVGTTLSAAALSSGLINRTGPTAPFTDTTDTAAAISAANAPGSSFYVDIKNATAFPQTLAGGTGVTFSSSTIIPANSVAEFLGVISADGSSVVLNHVFSVSLTDMNPEAVIALTTVGNGTITGAGIATQVTARGGAQSGTPFTDTTDIAANIIAAQPNVHVGASWEYVYNNNTNAVATLAGGTGVTISGATVIQPNSWVRYLVTYSAAATITMVAIGQGWYPHFGTVVANGATPVVQADTNVTASSNITLTLKTTGGTPHGAFVSAITPGTGFSINSLASDTSTYNYRIEG